MNEKFIAVNLPLEGNPTHNPAAPQENEAALGSITMGVDVTLEEQADAWLAGKMDEGPSEKTTDATASELEAKQVAPTIADALSQTPAAEATTEILEKPAAEGAPVKRSRYADSPTSRSPKFQARNRAEVAQLERARQTEGDARGAALIAFFSKHAARLLTLDPISNLNRQDQEDLIQEVAIKVLRHTETFRDMGVGVTPWLSRIAINTALDFYRKEQTRFQQANTIIDTHGDTFDHETPDHAKDVVSNDLVIDTLKMLEDVSAVPGAAEIIYAIDIQGMSYEEYATQSGVKLGTVRSRLARARRDLKNKVAPKLLTDNTDEI